VAEARTPRAILRVGRDGRARETASVPEEVVVRVLLNRKRLASLTASPLAPEELALGHLALLGRVRTRDDVRSAAVRRWRGEVHVVVEARATTASRAPSRQGPTTLPRGPRLKPADVHARMRALLDGSTLYREGGGVHTSALATPSAIVHIAADVGKVNTLDRLAGQALLAGKPTRGHALLTTGRLTGAMVGRGLAMGCALLVSHSGPTHAGVLQAEAAGATLVGYARGGSFNVYTHPRRIATR
jgi:FdhD protein